MHQENSLIIILQHFKLKLTNNNTGRETTGSSNQVMKEGSDEPLISPKDQGPECSKDPFSTFPHPRFSEPERKALCVVWMTVCSQETPTGSQEPIHSLTSVSRDPGHRESDLLRKESGILTFWLREGKGGNCPKLRECIPRILGQRNHCLKCLPDVTNGLKAVNVGTLDFFYV